MSDELRRLKALEEIGRELCIAIEAYIFSGLHGPLDGLVMAHLLKDVVLLNERYKSKLKPSTYPAGHVEETPERGLVPCPHCGAVSVRITYALADDS